MPENYKDSEESYPVVVILHGHGSTELGHGRLADALGRDGVIYVCVRAPYAWEEIMLGARQKSYSAWPSERIENEADIKQITPQYIDWIFACVDDAKKRYRIKGDKVYLWGHSQGAFFANACAMTYPSRVASYFAYAGGMMDDMKDEKYGAAMKEQGVKA